MKPNMVLTVTLSAVALLALTPAASAASAVTGPSGTDTAAMAEKGAETVRLDTSTRENFTASFTRLKASLSADDRLRLKSALAKLVAPYIAPAAGKAAADDGSSVKESPAFEDILYEKLGARLDRASFEDILALAG